MSKKIILFIIIILLIILTGLFFFKRHDKHDVSTKTNSITYVTIAPLQYHTIPQHVTSYGNTVSPQSSAVATAAAGIVKSIDFKPGQAIKKGDTLFTLKLNDIGNSVKNLRAKMLSSKLSYEIDRRTDQSYPGVIAHKDLEVAKFQYQQDLASYQAAISEAVVKAPIDGITSDTDLTIGSAVQAGDLLVHIISKQHLQIKFSLTDQYSKQVKLGQQVLFTPNNSAQVYKAKVSYIAPLLTPQGTLNLRANFTTTTSLQPNVFGQVKQLLNPNFKTLAVKQSYVLTDSKGFYLYSVKQGKVIKLYFQPGQISKDGYIEIKSGISAKTPIIISDSSALSAGQTVEAKQS